MLASVNRVGVLNPPILPAFPYAIPILGPGSPPAPRPVQQRKLSCREVEQFVWLVPLCAQESRELNLVPKFGCPPTTTMFSSRMVCDKEVSC